MGSRRGLLLGGPEDPQLRRPPRRRRPRPEPAAAAAASSRPPRRRSPRPRVNEDADGARVVLSSNAPLLYTSYEPRPDLLIVDLRDATVAAGFQAPATPGGGLVESIKFEELDELGKRITRLSIAHNPDSKPDVRSVGQGLAIAFSGPTAVAASEAESAPEPAPAAPAVAVASTPLAAPAAGGHRSGGPAVSAAARGETAHALEKVSVDSTGGRVSVTLLGDGWFSPKDFVLANPPRHRPRPAGREERGAPARRSPSRATLVSRVRVSQFQTSPELVTRVVIDLARPVAHAVVPDGERLAVVVGEGVTAAEAAPAPAPRGRRRRRRARGAGDSPKPRRRRRRSPRTATRRRPGQPEPAPVHARSLRPSPNPLRRPRPAAAPARPSPSSRDASHPAPAEAAPPRRPGCRVRRAARGPARIRRPPAPEPSRSPKPTSRRRRRPDRLRRPAAGAARRAPSPPASRGEALFEAAAAALDSDQAAQQAAGLDVPLADDLGGPVAVHGRADLARPEGRRHQGRLPDDLAVDRPEHRDRPRGPRHGDGPARGRPVGPGARPDPQAEQPRLRAREQHHAHRDDRQAPGRGVRPRAPRRGPAGRRADPHGHQEALLREGLGDRPDAAERHVQARRDRRRQAHEHADHPGDPDLPAGRAPAHRQPGHRDPAGRDRVADRRDDQEPRPQPRHQLERPRQGGRRAPATRRT